MVLARLGYLGSRILRCGYASNVGNACNSEIKKDRKRLVWNLGHSE
jgi:hypothetical protein